jgi:hypothetical protein
MTLLKLEANKQGKGVPVVVPALMLILTMRCDRFTMVFETPGSISGSNSVQAAFTMLIQSIMMLENYK